MYNITVEETIKFQKFLGLTDAVWVNVIIANDKVLFIQDSNEIFAVLQMNCVASYGAGNTLFRVKTKLLKALLIKGLLEIDVQEEQVKLSCYDEEERLIHSVKIPKHQAFTNTFNEKLRILGKTDSQKFNASGLKTAIGVLKITNSYLEVVNEVLGIIERDGTVVCCRADGIPDICLTSNAANKLMQCHYDWYRSQNYVYTLDDNLGVLANQCRGSGNDITAILQADDKSALVAEVDITNALNLFKKCDAKYLTINFDEALCEFQGEQENYSVPVIVTSLQKTEKCNISDITLGSRVVRDYTEKIGCRKLKIYVKKNYLRVLCDRFSILCRKVLI